MMYELGMCSAFEEERMGAASPWMVSNETLGAAAAQAASERAKMPLIVNQKDRAKSIDPRLQPMR
jgi:hypothetical protein